MVTSVDQYEGNSPTQSSSLTDFFRYERDTPKSIEIEIGDVSQGEMSPEMEEILTFADANAFEISITLVPGSTRAVLKTRFEDAIHSSIEGDGHSHPIARDVKSGGFMPSIADLEHAAEIRKSGFVLTKQGMVKYSVADSANLDLLRHNLGETHASNYDLVRCCADASIGEVKDLLAELGINIDFIPNKKYADAYSHQDQTVGFSISGDQITVESLPYSASEALNFIKLNKSQSFDIIAQRIRQMIKTEGIPDFLLKIANADKQTLDICLEAYLSGLEDIPPYIEYLQSLRAKENLLTIGDIMHFTLRTRDSFLRHNLLGTFETQIQDGLHDEDFQFIKRLGLDLSKSGVITKRFDNDPAINAYYASIKYTFIVDRLGFSCTGIFLSKRGG